MRYKGRLAVLLAGVAWVMPVLAEPVLPSGGQVAFGAATIGATADGLRIDQSSQRAVIDWQSFSVGAGGRVHFANGQGATLNRVLGGNPSSIAGQLSATGSLWLINPAGVLVSPTGQVITGGHFVASTRPVDGRGFMDGQGLVAAGGSAGGITNEGRIEAGGDTVLIGAFVDNRGQLAARGAASLVAADRVVLREAMADARIHIEAASGGSGDVSTAGVIEAAAAELRAVGGNVYALAADTGGVVRATGSVSVGGRVLLVGGRDVRISGTVDASGAAGGSIDATAGERVILDPTAAVLANGGAGDGGSIRIGGARQGGLPGETRPLLSAQGVFVEEGARIEAGSGDGRGGEVILWSEQRTRFDGLILADGPMGGGFVETSSKGALGIGTGQVRVGNGQWLLDPRDVVITTGGAATPPGTDVTINPPPGAGAYNVNGTSLISAINGGANVTVTTVQAGSTDAGNITISFTLNMTGSGNLTLLADNDIIQNNGITLSGSGNLLLQAARDIRLNPTPAVAIDISGSGSATVLAGRDILVQKQLRQTASATGSHILTAGRDIAFTSSVLKALGSTGSVTADAVGNITTTQPFTNNSSGDMQLTAGGGITLGGTLNAAGPGGFLVQADGSITINGAVTGTAASGGSFTFDAGNLVSANNQLQHSGSGNITLIGRGDGIRFGGSGNRNFFTTSGQFLLQAPGPEGDIIFGRTPDNFGNMRWSGGSGGLTAQAGRDVRLLPSPGGAGRWVRVGAAADTGPLTITAGRNVDILGGPFTDDFAEVLGQGAMTITAGTRILVQNGVSAGRIQARGPSLTLNAPLGEYAGLVESRGDTLLTGGTHAFSVSPLFRLGADRSFTLDAGSTMTASVPLEIEAPGSGDIRFGGDVTGTTLLAIAGDEFRIGAPVTMTGDSFNALVLVAGTKFINTAGDALSTPSPSGRWLTYSVSPFDDEGMDLLTPDKPNLYGISYAANPPGTIVPPPQSRRLYSFRPTLTLTADSATKLYGSLPVPDLGFTATGLVPGDSLADALTGTPTVSSAGIPATAPVGSYATTVLATASDQGYLLSLVNGTLTVNPAPLTITADAIAKIYGDADPALTFTGSGFVNGETTAVLTGSLVRAPGEDVGGYAISQGSLSAANYAISFVGATFTINPATLVVTALPVSRIYGDPDPSPLPFEAVGFRRGDTAATALTGALARAPGENVGLYAIGPGTLAAQNYVFSFTGANFTITPAPLAVDADDAAKLYGAPDPVFTFTASGFRLGDTAASLTGALSRDPGENVGVYDIRLGTLANPNYAISFTGGNFAIDPAPLSIVANPQAREYGLADPVFTFTATGFQFGEDASVLSGALSRVPGENVGLYPILIGNLGATNYTLQFTSADLSITPAPLLIIPANVSVMAADLPPDPPLAFSTIGFRRGDVADTALTGALTREDAGGTTPGVYQILPGTLAAINGNYTLSFAPATFTIIEQVLRIVALDQFKIYGEPDPTLTFTATGFLPGDDESILTGSLVRALGEDVGLYAILQGTLAAPGYTINFTPAFFVINPATLRVVAADATREYGLADSIPFAFTASGFQFGEDVSVLTGALGRDPGENVGTYAITQGNLSAKNYLFDFTPGTLQITPAPLTVVAANAGRIYGGTDPASFAFAASGFRLGDSAAILTGALARAPGENVGLYPILQNSLSAGPNYSITYTPGTFQISPAPLAVIADDKTREYGVTDPALTFAAIGLVLGDTPDTALTGALARAAGENVGVYGIGQGSLAASNYDISFTPGAFRITPAPLAVAALPVSRLYGDPDPSPLPFNATGFRLADTAATVLTGALRRAPGENVGIYGISLGTLTSNGNYALTFTGADFTITPASLLVVADDRSKVYGSADPALTFAASGFRLGDTAGGVLTGALARAPGESVAGSPYAITQGTLAANSNYAISFTGALFTITPAGLVVAADPQSKVYGDPDPLLTFAASGFVAGDTAATVLTGALARAPGENVVGSPYAITQGTLLANSNYTLTFTGNGLTITPAPLTVAALAAGKLYGDPDPALAFAASGFRLGDTAAGVLTGALVRAPGESVAGSPYAISQGTLAANSNYTLGFTGADFTISPAPLLVRADPQAKLYGTPDPLLTFEATGLRFADTVEGVVTGALARAPGENVAGSPYAITIGSLAANSNYALSFTGDFLTITPALLTASLVGTVERVYDATRVAPLSAANLALAGVVPGDDGLVSVAATEASYDTPDVGTGKLVTATGLVLSGPAAGNYRLDPGASGPIGIITPAPLRVTALDATRPLFRPNPPFELVADGLKGADSVTSIGLFGETDAIVASPPGDYPIRVAGTARNYVVTRVPGTLTVEPAPATVPPEPIEVPVLGGLAQQGVAMGSNAFVDTISPARRTWTTARQPLVLTSRFTVSIETTAPPPPSGIGGASAFDSGGGLRD